MNKIAESILLAAVFAAALPFAFLFVVYIAYCVLGDVLDPFRGSKYVDLWECENL